MDPMEAMSGASGPLPKNFDAENAENNEDVGAFVLSRVATCEQAANYS